MPAPRFSVCEFTSPHTTFEEDLDLLCRHGVEGVGICELKLRAGEEAKQLDALHARGLRAAICIPENIGPLPCEPVFPGPVVIEDRVKAMCESVERLAPFRPDSIVVITGSAAGRGVGDARQAAVDGLRCVADRAADLGVRLSIEPLRADVGLDVSFVSTIPETLDLIDEIDRPNIDIAYDVYHLWDTPDVLDLTRRHAQRFAGVHVCDWREPPRTFGDRLFPGDGTIDLPAMFGALEDGGFTGWYDLEIFSDESLPDSLWKLPPEELVGRGKAGFERAWQGR